MKKTLIIALAAVSAMTLSACGKMADLEAPTARSNSKWTERNREPATVLSPSSSNPIDGGAADPTGRRPDF